MPKKNLYAKILLLCIIALSSINSISAQESTPVKDLSYRDALILGIVEGVTEFLPISSTGHLIITNQILGLNGDNYLHDRSGNLILVNGQPVPLKEAINAYTIIIQLGAILAVFILFSKRIVNIFKGLLGQHRLGRRLAGNIIIAFIPAAITGLLLHEWIANNLFDPKIVVWALTLGGVFMIAIEWWRKKIKRRRKALGLEKVKKTIEELTWKESLMIGILQCFSMIPGTSRSMVTIIGGYFAGLTPKRSAEFSFLLGLVTLGAASCYTIIKDGENMIKTLELGPILIGCVVAFITGGFAVRWVIGYLKNHGIAIFGWYRLLLAAILFWVLQTHS